MLLLINFKWPCFFAELPVYAGAGNPFGEHGGVWQETTMSQWFLLDFKIVFCWVELGKQLVELLLVLPWVCLEIKSAFQ